ncbi:MAG: ABC transporter substrate-binding protein [Proteobacteria bacterium]|nr:ABC transporter substrate-binding protein [Pseudomonadota bacterium]MBI3500111.1 ABC transporter substrate-binding protein [Pseudomonadota bacterium]
MQLKSAVVGGVALLALMTAMGETSADTKVIKVVPHADLRVLDPHLATPLITKMHGALVYETLLTWDSKLAVKPMAAESMIVSADRLTYTFTLRPGMSFHDGSPVRSQDVIQSLKRWMARDTLGTRLNRVIAGFEVVSESTFRVKLTEPYGFVEFTLGAVGALLPQIMREKDALTDANTQVSEIVGSGPFSFARGEWVPGAKVVYLRNPGYQPRSEPTDGLAGARIVQVDRVEWIIIPDPATVAAALGAGEVDFWDTVALDQLPTLAKNKDIVIGKLVPLPYVGNIRMNQIEPPFQDVRIRRVVAALVDQGEFMAAAVGDPAWYSTCLSYFVCGSPNATLAGSELYAKPDLARAKRMLAESGYKGEKVVILGTKELAPIGGMVEVLTQRMKEVGFSVELQMMAWGVLTTMINKYPPDSGSWSIFATYSTGGVMHHPLTNIFADTNCEAKNVAGWPCDREAMRLKTEYLAAKDASTGKAALEALHRRLWEVVVYVPSGQFDAPFAWRKTLDGVGLMALPVFRNMTKN